LQATPQRVALDQGDGVHVATEAGVDVVHAFDATLRIGQQLGAVTGADQPHEQLQVAAQVVGRRGRGQDEVAQLARGALLRAQGHRAHVAPHVLEHLEAAAGAHAGTGIGVHVQPVGAAVSGTLHADGGVVRNTLKLLDAAHGTAPDYGRWRTGLYVPGCYTPVWQGPEAKKRAGCPARLRSSTCWRASRAPRRLSARRCPRWPAPRRAV